MLIWFAMLIPLFGMFIKVIFFSQKMKWWEFGIPFLISAALCAGFKVVAEQGATRDSEIWGGWVMEARYYERWNEYVHKTCSRQHCSGSGKTRSCWTEYYDCSYVANHPAYWKILDSNKQQHIVNKDTYNYLVQLFGHKPKFVDMKRSYHTIDGDMYQVHWPSTSETVEPITTEHVYENRIQASRSVFSYVPISWEDAQTKGLFRYPDIKLLNYPTVLGDCGTHSKAADQRLRYFNAVLGREKQLRIWFLCFQSTDPQIGELQEAFWVGGNKNEVVITIGTNKEGTVSWVHPFSWTDHKEPLIEIRDFISQQGNLNALVAAEFVGTKLKEGFVRKQFEDFSYLTVEPPLWSIILTYVTTLLVNFGLSWWLINNEFQERSSR